MKMIRLCLLVACAALLTGCLVPSLNPLFSEDDLVAYSDLLGTWSQDGKSDNSWTFEKAGKAYKLTHLDEKKRTAAFTVLVGKIGTNSFMDTFALDSKLEEHANGMELAHLVPVHLFAKIVKHGPDLQLVALDPEWLDERVKENPKLIPLLSRKDYRVLTASTAELQAFVAAHGGDTNAFKHALTLVRQK